MGNALDNYVFIKNESGHDAIFYSYLPFLPNFVANDTSRIVKNGETITFSFHYNDEKIKDEEVKKMSKEEHISVKEVEGKKYRCKFKIQAYSFRTKKYTKVYTLSKVFSLKFNEDLEFEYTDEDLSQTHNEESEKDQKM